MPEPPRVAWWKRKRWWAAIAAWIAFLPLLYALSVGPALYATERGWIADVTYDSYARLTFPVFRNAPESYTSWYGRYLIWWDRLGRLHAGLD